MEVCFHNAASVRQDVTHFEASANHAAFDEITITAQRADGETLVVKLFMADGCAPKIEAA